MVNEKLREQNNGWLVRRRLFCFEPCFACWLSVEQSDANLGPAYVGNLYRVLFALHILEPTALLPLPYVFGCALLWQAFQGSPANFGGAVRRIRQACLSSDGSVTPKEQTFLTLFLVRCVQHLVSRPATIANHFAAAVVGRA